MNQTNKSFHMKTSLKNIFSLAFVTGTMVLLSSCGSKSREEQLIELKKQHAQIEDQMRQLEAEIAAEDSTGGWNRKIKDVKISSFSPASFRHYIDVQGHVDSEESVTLTAKSPGMVTAVLVIPGQTVSEGQLLATLDDDIYRKQLEGVQTQLNLATDIFNRQKKLWDQKIGSEVQFLTAKTNKEALEKQVQTLQETIDLSKIKSPISGTVDAVDIKVGQMAAPGIPAMRIVNLSKMKVKAEVAEAYASKVFRGNPVVLNFPDLGREMDGSISYAARVINPMTRTFTTEVNLPSGQQDLRPNMISVMKIIDYKSDSAFVLPISLVQSTTNESFVFVAVQEEGKWVARRRPVVIGHTYNGQAEIVSGITSEDKVVVSGQTELSDGVEIRF
jgi:RND family efflux transporter MFP subunit